LTRWTYLFALLIPSAYANTEKVIFVAPEAVSFPNATPALDNLRLHSLTPARSSFRTSLPVVLTSEEYPRGLESWFLLRELKQRQRYELRICWAAVVRIKCCYFLLVMPRFLTPK